MSQLINPLQSSDSIILNYWKNTANVSSTANFTWYAEHLFKGGLSLTENVNMLSSSTASSTEQFPSIEIEFTNSMWTTNATAGELKTVTQSKEVYDYNVPVAWLYVDDVLQRTLLSPTQNGSGSSTASTTFTMPSGSHTLKINQNMSPLQGESTTSTTFTSSIFKSSTQTFSFTVTISTKSITAYSKAEYELSPGGSAYSSTQSIYLDNTGALRLGSNLIVGSTTSITGDLSVSGKYDLSAGTGISFDGKTITNAGIVSLLAGTGISVSGNQITNTGIISVSAGTGISVSGTNPLTITNSSPNVDYPGQSNSWGGTQTFDNVTINGEFQFTSTSAPPEGSAIVGASGTLNTGGSLTVPNDGKNHVVFGWCTPQSLNSGYCSWDWTWTDPVRGSATLSRQFTAQASYSQIADSFIATCSPDTTFGVAGGSNFNHFGMWGITVIY